MGSPRDLLRICTVVLPVVACAGHEAPVPHDERPKPAEEDAAAHVDAAPVASEARPTPSPPGPPSAQRVLRGELIRTYVSYGALRGFAKSPCGRAADAGACSTHDEAAAVRAALAKLHPRLDEVIKFAESHPDAHADEAPCLNAVLGAGDRLAKTLEHGGAATASRAALQGKLDSCDAAIGSAVALVGNPLPARTAATPTYGLVRPEDVQRTVRQNFGRFKRCYQDGLRRNPSLGGRLAVSFIIDTDGSVIDERPTPDSTLPDEAVTQCIVSWFRDIHFVPPEGGYVTIVYPVIFSPGDP